MKTLIVVALCLLAANAQANQIIPLQSMTGASINYMAYQAPSIRAQDLASIATKFAQCWKVTAQEFFQRENLAVDGNVVGAFYCNRSDGARAYPIVRQFN